MKEETTKTAAESATAVPTKRCSKCGEVKPVTEFGKNNQSKDGLRCHCKECYNRYRRSFYLGASTAMRTEEAKAAATPPNPEFAAKSPREIIGEIRARIAHLRTLGYNYEGKLTYLQTINL